MTVTLADIVRRVAELYGVSTNIAAGFVYGTIDEVVRALDSGNEVKLRGIGTLSWRFAKGRSGVAGYTTPIPDGLKLRFTPARRFRRRRGNMSDTEGMSKYGVEFDQEKAKYAEAGAKEGSCPTCKRSLDDAGACPVHGTEPLEPTQQARHRRNLP